MPDNEKIEQNEETFEVTIDKIKKESVLSDFHEFADLSSEDEMLLLFCKLINNL